jgi:hypothetical protein
MVDGQKQQQQQQQQPQFPCEKLQSSSFLVRLQHHQKTTTTR